MPSLIRQTAYQFNVILVNQKLKLDFFFAVGFLPEVVKQQVKISFMRLMFRELYMICLGSMSYGYLLPYRSFRRCSKECQLHKKCDYVLFHSRGHIGEW